MGSMPKHSRFLDVLIGLLFFLILHILFFGGFHFILYGMKVSATTPGKPALILVIAFLLKIACMNWRSDIEKKLLLLYSIFFLIFIFGELASRIAFLGQTRNDLKWASKNFLIRKNQDPENLHLSDIIRISNNNKIIYKLLPGALGKFVGADVHINAQGFRDSEDIERKKDSGEFRIVGLGDSNLFGWGVKFQDTLGERVEAELNLRAPPGKKFRFINMGVPGYNTAMEVETFFEKGLSMRPDMVIIYYARNDLTFPNYLMKKEDPWTSLKSFFFYHVVKLLGTSGNRAINLYGLKRTDVGDRTNLITVPEKYRFLVGKEAFRREIRRLKNRCEELQIPLIAVVEGMGLPSDHPDSTFGKLGMQEAGIAHVMSLARMGAFLNQESLNKEDLFISRNDRHPNLWGHRLIGQNLVSLILSPEFSGRPDARKLASFLKLARNP